MKYHPGECPLWVISGHFALRKYVRFTPESGYSGARAMCPLPIADNAELPEAHLCELHHTGSMRVTATFHTPDLEEWICRLSPPTQISIVPTCRLQPIVPTRSCSPLVRGQAACCFSRRVLSQSLGRAPRSP